MKSFQKFVVLVECRVVEECCLDLCCSGIVAWTGSRCVAQGCCVSVAMDLSLGEGLRVIASKRYPVISLLG
jgi:hypothetical protein